LLPEGLDELLPEDLRNAIPEGLDGLLPQE